MSQLPKKYKILLVGDVCIDRYNFGICAGLSPEAPVPIFKLLNIEDKQGMAGNVLNNLLSLGLEVDSVFGAERSIKTRFVDIKSQQHLLRIDDDRLSDPVTIPNDLEQYDAVVVSDYGKGSCTYDNMARLVKTYTGPIFVDTKKQDLSMFKNCYVKINDLEYSKITSRCSNLIVTLGAQGARYKNKIYPTKKINVVDVCGAGDTFLATLCYGFLKTRDIEIAIDMANTAASLVVTKLGTQALTQQEIIEIDRATADKF